MSFTDIRDNRQAKEARSYVGSSLASKPNDAPPLVQDPPEPLFGGLPSTIEIRTSPERGRAIYSKERLKRSGTIFSTKPPIYVLSTKNLEHFCSTCISPAPPSGLKRCTKCKTVWYCNPTCQTNDWALHRKECAAMQRWAAGAPSSDVAVPAEPIRCLGRMLWGKRKRGLNSVWTREIDAMQSHRTALPPDAAESHTHLAHAVIRYLSLTAPEELVPFGVNSAAGVVDLISRFATNSITLTSPSLAPLGVCVSPLVALINHSCDPNAVVVFPRSTKDPAGQEPEVQVIAIRDISPGEEIFTSYIDTTLPRIQRQAALLSTYNFSCRCRLCSRPPEPDPREALACPKNCGGSCPFPSEEDPLTRCVKCKSAVASTDAVLDALRIGQEALQKATRLQFSDLPKAQQLTNNMISILTSTKAVPSSHPLLALTRLHQSLLLAAFPSDMTQDALDGVIRVSFASVTGLTSVLSHGHPARALALAELGKLLAVDEPAPRPATTGGGASTFPPSGPARLRLACETLVRARDELLVSFGERNDGGEVGREVREMVVRVERELAAWSQGIRNVIEDTPNLKEEEVSRFSCMTYRCCHAFGHFAPIRVSSIICITFEKK
ncbi:SET domain-containing protein [Russula earlei]|uniref:SET domain-containing protein n=1 Tax=Russula earlei TaxID=71964 RepID=A0ACC0TYT8_9AGAM|nr:SET domain-containing protein [Russula earlei]